MRRLMCPPAYFDIEYEINLRWSRLLGQFGG